jgi:hypothetical protein
MVSSLFCVIWIGLGASDFSTMILPYLAVIAAFLAVRLLAFISAWTALHRDGRMVPTINPFRWLVIGGTSEVWTVGEYHISSGTGEIEHGMKFRSTNGGETAPVLTLPKVDAAIPFLHRNCGKGG